MPSSLPKGLSLLEMEVGDDPITWFGKPEIFVLSCSVFYISRTVITDFDYSKLPGCWALFERVPQGHLGETPIGDRAGDDGHLPGKTLRGLRYKTFWRSRISTPKIYSPRTNLKLQTTLFALDGESQVLSDKRKRSLAQAIRVSRQKQLKNMPR